MLPHHRAPFNGILPLYRAQFTLARTDTIQATPTLETVVNTIRDWLVPSISSSITTAELLEGAQYTTLQGRVETVHVEDMNTEWFGLRFEHPDNANIAAVWRTDITTEQYTKYNGELKVTIELAHGTPRMKPRIAPQVSRPRIVPMLMEQFGAWIDGMPFSVEPIILNDGAGANHISMLPTFILSKERNMPLVYLSAEGSTNRPVIDENYVAQQLAGIAHVVAAHSANDRVNRSELGNLHAYNGTVRVYWPSENIASDDPHLHQFWTADVVKTSPMPKILLKLLAQESLHHRGSTSFNVIRRVEYEKQLKVYAAQFHEPSPQEKMYLKLAESYDEENKTLRVQTAELEERIRELTHTVDSKDAMLAELRHNIREIGKYATQPTPIQPVAAEKTAETVKEAVDSMLEKYSDRLAIVGRVRSQAVKSKFNDPQLLQRALEWIATKCTNGARETELIDSARKELGLTYKPFQKDSTMKAHYDEYHVVHEGRTISLERHLGRGTKPDEETTLRIAFGVDKESGKIVIGYIGQHQRNKLTN